MPDNIKKAGRKPTPQGTIKWDIKRRFEFIEFHVFWEGPLKRAHLTKNYGISTVQASKDIKTYKSLAPENLLFNSSTKTYSSSETFAPLFINTDPSAYLSNLMAKKSGFFSVEVSIPHFFPKSDIVPSPYRKINPATLRSVILAIKNHLDIEIQYQSMSSPNPIWRWITPHALNFDGHRWHIRCFCHMSKVFKDFLIARIINLGDQKASNVDPKKDLSWSEEINVKIGPHPDLSDGQKSIIEYDYDMQDGVTVIPVKKASLLYFYRKMGFDKKIDGLDPKAVQVVLLNREAVENQLNLTSYS